MMLKQLKINPKETERGIVKFIQQELGKTPFHRGIIGLSGGLDSTVVAYLTAKAIGSKNVLALILPFQTGSLKNIADGKTVAKKLCIRYKITNITPMLKAYFKNFSKVDRIRLGNKISRERMSILYDVAKKERALVIGTSNRTELLLGYFTKYGDAGVDIEPLGSLYKSQVFLLAEYLNVPGKIIKKVPSADLWKGQTDEGELGLSYEEMDEILYFLVDRGYKKNRISKLGYPEKKIEKVESLFKNSSHKRNLPRQACPRRLTH
ncbi:MAG: NAD+ synthase [Candidatus Omnitrophica bacterium]|nr:NAD+ synthase [Candidatus Omnitrophota bacterium]